MDKYVSVKEIMGLINTPNRGSADYFIVDKIEELCNEKGKILEELKEGAKNKIKQNNLRKVIAAYSYEHNDGDQIWEDQTTYYQLSNGTFQKEYCEGYYGKTNISSVKFDEIADRMNCIEKEVQRKNKAIKIYGTEHPATRGGYTITVPLQKCKDAVAHKSGEFAGKEEPEIELD